MFWFFLRFVCPVVVDNFNREKSHLTQPLCCQRRQSTWETMPQDKSSSCSDDACIVLLLSPLFENASPIIPNYAFENIRNQEELSCLLWRLVICRPLALKWPAFVGNFNHVSTTMKAGAESVLYETGSPYTICRRRKPLALKLLLDQGR